MRAGPIAATPPKRPVAPGMIEPLMINSGRITEEDGYGEARRQGRFMTGAAPPRADRHSSHAVTSPGVLGARAA
jgi:hypothetical protein